MKVVLLAVLLIVVGLVAYNAVTTGEFRLLPPAASAEELQLDRLQERLDAAQERLQAARHTAGQAGADAQAAARRELDAITDQLSDLRGRLEAGAQDGAQGATKALRRLKARAHHKADKLQRALEAFKRELK